MKRGILAALAAIVVLTIAAPAAVSVQIFLELI